MTEGKVIYPGPYGSDIFSGNHQLSTDQIGYIVDQASLAGDVITRHLDGFGSDSFLVLHGENIRGIVAEFKHSSGSLITRAFMANAINTWPLLALEVLERRKRLRESEPNDEASETRAEKLETIATDAVVYASKLEARAEKLQEALREAEWGRSGRCPTCDNYRAEKHAAGCKLSAALTDTPSPKQEG